MTKPVSRVLQRRVSVGALIEIAVWLLIPYLYIGFVWALVMGLLGGLLPALRAARLPVATALRAV